MQEDDEALRTAMESAGLLDALFQRQCCLPHKPGAAQMQAVSPTHVQAHGSAKEHSAAGKDEGNAGMSGTKNQRQQLSLGARASVASGAKRVRMRMGEEMSQIDDPETNKYATIVTRACQAPQTNDNN